MCNANPSAVYSGSICASAMLGKIIKVQRYFTEDALEGPCTALTWIRLCLGMRLFADVMKIYPGLRPS